MQIIHFVKMLSLKNSYNNFVYIINVTSGNAMSNGIAQHKMKHSSRLYSLQVNIHPGNSGARRIFVQTSGLVNSKNTVVSVRL